MKQSIYDFSLKRIGGGEIQLKDYRNMKMLIVNVASECGYTHQYQQLQELYSLNKDKLMIIACPCDDFGGQEPGSNEQIESFCSITYGVTFPISEKISINTSYRHPLYLWLSSMSVDLAEDTVVKWNFQKYLIDEQGKLIAVLDPSISPFDNQILDWIGEKSEVV